LLPFSLAAFVRLLPVGVFLQLFFPGFYRKLCCLRFQISTANVHSTDSIFFVNAVFAEKESFFREKEITINKKSN
jgi:hypothetical protein